VTHLILENVRTFVGRHTIRIAPLTVLVGENSSGKSTFLAALSAVTDRLGFPFLPGFNRPPYELGNYDTIATFKGGKYGRARSFSLGYSDDHRRKGRASGAVATYRSRDGQPELAHFAVDGPSGSISLEVDSASGRAFSGKIRVNAGTNDEEFGFSIPRSEVEGRAFGFPDLLMSAFYTREHADRDRAIAVLGHLSELAYRTTPVQSESIAPIRSKPARTYGTVTDEFTPGGDQVPFVLERLLRDSSSRESMAVVSALDQFGNESGLFESLGIRRLGAKAGEPFQVMIRIAGKNRNMIDVGYGVSQALPVVVQSALSAEHELLLIQQPEVHLHPRAQAALGSLFVQLVANAKKRFVVESHSDFLIDRIRQEVANGRMDAKDVRILFFERQGYGTSVSELRLDAFGNVIGAPPSYRAFFLNEELRLLSRGVG